MLNPKNTSYRLEQSLLIVASFIGVFLAWNGAFSSPIGDFGNYYFGSQFLLEGIFDRCIYDVATFNLMVSEREPGLFLNYTPVPPFTALFYVPFTFLEIHWAKFVFNLISLFSLIWAFAKAKETFGLNYKHILLAAALLIFPIKSNFDQGQTYLILLAIMIFGLIQLKRGNQSKAGFLWAIPAMLKIFPVVIFLLPLLRKKWKVMLSALALTIVLFAFSLIWLEPILWKEYLVDILPRLFKGEINDPFASSYQSTTVFFKRLFVLDAQLNPSPWLDTPFLANSLDALFKSIILFGLIGLILQSESLFQRFSLALLFTILLTGYGSTYGLIFLLPFMVTLLQNRYAFNCALAYVLGIAASSVFLANLLHVESLVHLRLALILLVFVAFWLHHPFGFNRKIFAFALLYFALNLVSFKPNDLNAQPVSLSNAPLLGVDLRQVNGTLILQYFDQNGVQNFNTGITGEFEAREGHFFDKTGSEYFLSDCGRGVGFKALFVRKEQGER